jgi:serine/threonine protein kinase
MKLVRHPNVVRLHEVIRAHIIKTLFTSNCIGLELLDYVWINSILLLLFQYGTTTDDLTFYLQVLASRTKIYIILEFVTGGELFDKIVSFWTHCILQVFAPSLLLGLGYTFVLFCSFLVLVFSICRDMLK